MTSLSARELDVLREMAAGRSIPAIARHFHVSESAVSKHITSISTKLGLVDSPDVDRRVRAVLTYMIGSGDASSGAPGSA